MSTYPTFEVWYRLRGFLVPLQDLSDAELAAHREGYELQKRGASESRPIEMRPLRPGPGDRLYAVVVSDGEDRRLVSWVRSNSKGEVFVVNPGRDRKHQPHTSLHVGRSENRTGVLQVRSYPDEDRPPLIQVPRPSPSALPAQGVQVDVFLGLTVELVRRMGVPYRASEVTGLLEIPISTLEHGKHQLTTDVVPKGEAPLTPPAARVCLVKRFEEVGREVVVALWDVREDCKV